MQTEYQKAGETFRDKIATVDKNGKRIWMYPQKTKGKFTSYRNYVGYTFLLFFFIAPFLRIGGEPLILMNIPERHFVLFGIVFWPQDFSIFLLAMLAFVIFVVLFTVIYGRVFCGWACPQTIFMEMVFRKVEYWIEGDRNQQIKLDQSAWTFEKTWKKSSKHLLFFMLSFVISNLFLTYIIGTDAWWKMVTEDIGLHLAGLSTMVIFTIIFYAVYARFREQICTTICPYGRLQGVMLDKKSVAVAYDYVRGETRGKLLRNENRETSGKGDCIDCKLCIHVCPTGIDIRDGIQMECINCTACIDVCDDVMGKIGFKKGLIRYASEEGIVGGKPFRLTKRAMAYSAILVILLLSITMLLVTRPDVETSLLRTPGILYQHLPGNKYSNLYTLKIVNKTHKHLDLQFRLENIPGEIKLVGQTPDIKPGAIAEGALFIVLDQKEIKKMKTAVNIGVYEGGECIETVKTTFLGPAN